MGKFRFIGFIITACCCNHLSGQYLTCEQSPYAFTGDCSKTLLPDYQRDTYPEITIINVSPDSTFLLAKFDFANRTVKLKDLNDRVIFTDTLPVNRKAFTTADPKSKEMPWISPYAYCLNNPVKLVDIDGQRPTEYEAALMAQYIYFDKETKNNAIKTLNDKGWTISTFKTSIEMNHTSWNEDNLQSVLFQKETNGSMEYTYVFAGTDSMRDAIEDIAQITGLSPQYNSAIKNARTLSEELGNNNELTFVGHSLGGGEAAASSMATGRAAITFNPASVSPSTNFFHNLGDASKITNYRTVGVPIGIGNIKIGGCFVNNLQDNIGMRAPGKTIAIPLGLMNPFKSHKIDNIVEYFKQKQ